MVSYLPYVNVVVGNTFGQIIGDPTLLGFVCLLFMFILWAYSGVGFDVGVIIFSPLILLLSLYGFLPAWTGFVCAIALGLLLMKVVSGVVR